MSPPPKHTTERTMMAAAPAFHPSGRIWRDFKFKNLEKVSRTQIDLLRRLQWLLPGVPASGPVSDAVRARLQELFELDVRMSVEYVHVVPPRRLRKYLADPTFLALLAPLPHKTRGVLEVDLELAHAAVDILLGGAGEMVALRPLTDIEEGVMSYVVLETLKALSPNLDPGLPRLRLESMCRSVEEMLQVLGDEPQVAVVQLKCVLGQHAGYLRIFLPSTVLELSQPIADTAERRARWAALAQQHLARLARVKTWLRAEIGRAELSSGELADLRERDVMVVEALTARPDRGDGGSARLRVGAGQLGGAEAEILLEDGRYVAKVVGFFKDAGARIESDELAEAERSGLTDVDDPEAGEALEADEATNPHLEIRERENVDESKMDGADLLNDIPLQIAVELARVPISAEEVLSLKVGQVIDLNRVPGEPVELSVNGKVVARGELVEVENHLGVRILSLAG